MAETSNSRVISRSQANDKLQLAAASFRSEANFSGEKEEAQYLFLDSYLFEKRK